MSAKKKTDLATRLEKKLAHIKAAERKKFINKDVVRLEKNGDLSYETVRTFRTPTDSNFYTESPASPENGQQISAGEATATPPNEPAAESQVAISESVTAESSPQSPSANSDSTGGISIHDDQTSGQQFTGLTQPVDGPVNRRDHAATSDDESADPLDELIARALSRPRRGRPAVFDEHSKGKLVALLSLGMSLRQAAAVLGVSHGTIRNTLKADPALAEEITAARFQAQLQPLACVIREARRSWKAATWLLKYLDAKIASHEETPDERRDRQRRESDELFERAIKRGAKTR